MAREIIADATALIATQYPVSASDVWSAAARKITIADINTIDH